MELKRGPFLALILETFCETYIEAEKSPPLRSCQQGFILKMRALVYTYKNLGKC